MKLFALVALAAVQAAGPPPPEVAVVVPNAGMTDFAEQMLTRVAPEDGSGWFRRVPSAFSAADFDACSEPGVQPEACIRGILAARGAAELEGPPTVVVALSPGPGFLTGWTCIGIGGAPTAPDRQNISLDWSRGPDGVNAQSAAGCVLAAAAESGW